MAAELPENIVLKASPRRLPGLRGQRYIHKWFPPLTIEKLWRRYALGDGLRLLREHECALIFATSPPPACLLLAADLKRRTGLPLVLDYRDLWSGNPHRVDPTPLHRRYHLRLERGVLREADAVVTISQRMAAQVEAVLPAGERPWKQVHILPNGYDPLDFDLPARDPEPFVCAHIGSIYGGRVPVALHFIRALASYEADHPQAASRLTLRFVGGLHPSVHKALEESLKRVKFEVSDRVPHAEAIRLMQSASLLLLITDYKEMGSMTTKVFEYLAVPRPILSVGRSEFVESTLRGLPACRHVDGGSLSETLAAFTAMFAPDGTGAFQADSALRRGVLARYDRRSLTGELAEILNLVVGARG